MKTVQGYDRRSPLDKCYACGKPFRDPDNRTSVFLPDDDHRTVLVGPECFRRVVKAAASGYQPTRGGPRLFLERLDAINAAFNSLEPKWPSVARS